MAMNGDTLGDLIRTNIDSAVAANAEANPTQRQAVFRAIGNAIVDHITANMQITFRATDVGIQRADVANVPNTATLGPAAPVQLPAGNFE